MSCYSSALVANKLAYSVQFLKQKLTNDFWVTVRSGTYFFKKTALMTMTVECVVGTT
jgi:hypothetical protein